MTTTYPITDVTVDGRPVVGQGALALSEPTPGEHGERSWEARVATRRRLPHWLLALPPQSVDAQVTAGGITFTGSVTMEVMSNRRQLLLRTRGQLGL
jgi:hypothetical protein